MFVYIILFYLLNKCLESNELRQGWNVSVSSLHFIRIFSSQVTVSEKQRTKQVLARNFVVQKYLDFHHMFTYIHKTLCLSHIHRDKKKIILQQSTWLDSQLVVTFITMNDRYCYLHPVSIANVVTCSFFLFSKKKI